MKKKLFIILLSIIVTASFVPLSVFAETFHEDKNQEQDEAMQSESQADANDTDYMCLKNYFDPIVISMVKVGEGQLDNIVLECSKDKEEWVDFDSSTSAVRLEATEQIFLRAKDGYSWPDQDESNYWSFVMKGEGKVDASGNIMSLLDNSCQSKTVSKPYTFTHLFDGCVSLMIPPKLPATTISDCAYSYMFKNCTNLRSYDEIPATTLGASSMKGMFYGCTCLTLARPLDATKMAKNAYEEMFCNCTELVYPPSLPAREMADYCYKNMFYGCSALLSAPFLPAVSTSTGCYESMFKKCVGMKEGPKISATSLASECCKEMFYSCSKLQFISVGFNSWGKSNATANWVYGVNSAGALLCPSSLPKTKDNSHVPKNYGVNSLQVQKMKPIHARSANPNECILEWEKIDYVQTQYYIYRGTSPSGDWGAPIATSTDEIYYDKDVLPNHVYYYMIKPAVLFAGQTFYGAYSDKDYGNTSVREITGFTCKAKDVETVALDWDNGVEGEEYWIYRGMKPSGDWGSVHARVTNYYTSSFFEKHPDVKPGNKYYYMVRKATKGKDGKYYFGPYSKVDYAYPRVPVPSSFKAWASSKNSCQVSWNKISGNNVSYLVYRGYKPSGNWGSAIKEVTGGATSYTDKNLASGRKYYYMVRAKQYVDGVAYFSDYTNVDYGYPR